MLYLGGQPLWTFYASLVRDVKTAQHGLARTMSLAIDKWLGDEQFRGLVQVLLRSENFDRIGRYLEFSQHHLPEGSDCNMESFVHELFFYILSLLEKRASSLSKYNLPPEVYADLLSEDDQLAQPALDLLLSDWKTLVALESNAKHQTLAADLRVAVAPAVRLTYQLFEQEQQESGKKLLKGMLLVLPDSKLIEDIHGRIRNDARANISKKQTFNQIQQVVMGSSALESRGINHPAAVSKSVFKLRWKQTSGKRSFKAAFVSKTEKLPKKYSRLLGSKSWGAML